MHFVHHASSRTPLALCPGSTYQLAPAPAGSPDPGDEHRDDNTEGSAGVAGEIRLESGWRLTVRRSNRSLPPTTVRAIHAIARTTMNVGVEQQQLAGLITRRPQVQVLPPRPIPHRYSSGNEAWL